MISSNSIKTHWSVLKYYSDNSIAAIMPMRLIGLAYGIYTRVVFVSEIERVSAANESDFWYKNNEWVNTVRSTLRVVLCLLYTYWDKKKLLSSNVCEVTFTKLQEKVGILARNSHTSVASDWMYHFLTCKKPRSRFWLDVSFFSRVKTIVHSSDWLELICVSKFTTQLFGEYFSVCI